MTDDRIVGLVEEIRTLYGRQCALAERYAAVNEAEILDLKEKLRPRPHPTLPELERFETAFDGYEALKKAYEQPAARRRREWLMVFCWLGLFVINWQVLGYTGSLATAVVVCGVLGGTLVIAVGHRHVFARGAVQRSLREQLRAQGVPICLSCGYDLRGQVAPRCPECGAVCEAYAGSAIAER